MSKKRVTSFDVAKHAGVSRSLVSAVINNTPGIGISKETREHILKSIEELNYHVDAGARSMKTGRSKCIAAFGCLESPLFPYLLEGVQLACVKAGYHILISGHIDGKQDRYELLNLYYQRRIDGLITLDDTSYYDEAWRDEINKSRIPYVSVEGYVKDEQVHSILVDYAQSVRDALQFVSKTIRQNPVYIEVYNNESSTNWAEQQRRLAYIEWCKSKQAEPVIISIHLEDEQRYYDLLQQYQKEHGVIPPILINWSYGAIYLYRAAYKLGLTIGKDIHLMSADNTIRGNQLLVPTLSAMNIPYKQMGERAVIEVLKQMDKDHGSDHKKILFTPEILQGESV